MREYRVVFSEQETITTRATILITAEDRSAAIAIARRYRTLDELLQAHPSAEMDADNDVKSLQLENIEQELGSDPRQTDLFTAGATYGHP